MCCHSAIHGDAIHIYKSQLRERERDREREREREREPLVPWMGVEGVCCHSAIHGEAVHIYKMSIFFSCQTTAAYCLGTL